MISDANQVERNSSIETDICIVGGGAAGIALGKQLSSNSSLNVVILESGGFLPDFETQNLAKGDFSKNYSGLDTVRIRSFGGTTFHWNGYHRPFDSLDFENRHWIPGSGWPFNRTEIDAYYAEALGLLELESNDFVLADLEKQHSLDLFALDPERFYHRPSRLRPVRFGEKYKSEFQSFKNVDVLLHANCVNLNLDKNSGSINTLDVATLKGNAFSVTSKKYVLASGGIENARLLLTSEGITPGGIGNENDLVGRYFMEHPHLFSGFLLFPTIKDKDKAINTYFSPAMGVVPSLALDASVQEREEIGNFVGNIRPFSGYPTDNFIGFKSALADLVNGRITTASGQNFIASVKNIDDIALEAWSRLFNYERIKNSDRLLAISTTIEQVPNPDSRVTLSDDVDALGVKRARLDWRLTDLDKRTIKIGWKLIGDELARLGLAKVWLKVPEKDDPWPNYLHWGYHHMGTTRMNDDPKLGVVNSDCKVHGTNNLYIAGSSVFPTAGSSTPTTTLLALALRLGDHLKKDLQNGS